ncbi:MAG: 50S ribosomal protein L10 [Armatimonadetes bacterium]|nr:50S ribosomal protein L10 [Armatimonadota bacterium]
MARSEKVEQVEAIRQKLDGASAVILTDYRGLNVPELGELRGRLREAHAEYKVVKNTLMRIAAESLGVKGLEAHLEGPTAVAFVHKDVTAAAKVLQEFIRQYRKLEVKGGLVEGRVLGADQVKVLADLPSREVLLARVVGGIQSPLAGLVGVLNGTVRALVYALDAIRQQKEQGAGDAAAP